MPPVYPFVNTRHAFSPSMRVLGRVATTVLVSSVAIGATVAAPAQAATKAPAITGAWARTSPANATNGAAYMTIKASKADRLLSASVPATIAAKTEIHETVMVTPTTMAMGAATTTMAMGATTTMAMGATTTMAMGATTTMAMGATSTTMAMGASTTMAMGDMSGAMTMRPVAAIELPAGKAVELKPGGYHIMLLGLAGPLKTGASFTITLKFEKAGLVKVKVPVRQG